MKHISTLILGFGAALSLAAAPVTFKVDLSVKAGEGQFDPTLDLVEVRGAFNGWGAGSVLADPDGDRVYEGVVDLGEAVFAVQEYKFVYIKESDGSVVWESTPNRSFVPTGAAQTLETVYFSDDSVVSVPVKGEILFAVDMSVQAGTGAFVKGTDEAWVRGNKMGWNAPPDGLQLFEDAARPGIYTNTFLLDPILTGEPVEYKFTIWRPASGATVWEEGGNHRTAFEGTEPDADGDTFLELQAGPLYFNNLAPDNALSVDTAVTFRVNMASAQRLDGTPFSPGFEGVWVNGNIANWWGWGSSPAEFLMTDDGTSGDETAGDLIYSLTVIVPRGANKTLDYKYGIDSLDNEAAFADNHVRLVREEGAFTLPLDVFGEMVKETTNPGADLGSLSIQKAANNSVTLNWTGGAGIRLQKAETIVAPAWGDVAGSSGVSTITLPVSGKTGFYRLIRN